MSTKPTPGYNEASKRAAEAAKVEQQKQAAEEAKKREILNRSRTPGYVSSLDQNPEQAINQNRFTARERAEISGASAKVQAKADAKEFAKQEYAKAKAEAGPGKSVSQSLKIDIETGGVRGHTTTRDIRSGVPTRQYSTTYENPYHNQEFGTRRIGDWMRKEQAKKDRELSAAKTIPEFGDILKRQTTKKTIDNESAKQFMKDYADMQLGNIRRSRELKGQGDFSIATPKKGGGFEQTGADGEIFQFDFVQPKAANYHYFVDVGGPQKTVYSGPNQPFLEVPKETDPFTGFANYFRNIVEFGASGAGFAREAKYQPEAESAAFSAIFGFGERAVRGVPLEANLPFTAKEFGDIGLAVQKNPGYFGGGIAASVLTTVFPYGKVATLGRVGVRAAKGLDIFANLTKGGKTTAEPFANFGKVVSRARVQSKPYDVLQDLARSAKNTAAKTQEITVQSIVPKLFRDTDLIGSTPKGPRSFRSISSIFERTSPIEGGGRGQTTIVKEITKQTTRQRKQGMDPKLAEELKASLDTTPITTVIKPSGQAAKESKEIEKAISESVQGQKAPVVPPLFGESKAEKAARLSRLKELEKQMVPGISGQSARDKSFLRAGVLLGFKGATGAERKGRRGSFLDVQNDILRVPASTPTFLLGPQSKALQKSFTKDMLGTKAISASMLDNLLGAGQRSRQSSQTAQILKSALKLETPQLFRQATISRSVLRGSTGTDFSKLVPRITDIPSFKVPKTPRSFNWPGFEGPKKKKRGKKGKTSASLRTFVSGDIVGAFLGSESPITKKLYKEFGRSY